MRPAAAIDLSHRLLHRLGWSSGESRFQMPGGMRFWQVDAARDGNLIVATARTQAEAWWECCRLAGVVQRDGD